MTALLEELTTDFGRGQFEDVAATRYPPNVVSSLINGRVEPDGTISRRSGTKRTHAAALVVDGIGYGAIEFVTAAGVTQLITFFGVKAFKSIDNGLNWVEIATGLREDYYSLATVRVGGTMYLYAANGDATVKRWDGVTWDTNPNAPAGVKYLAVFNGRLWYAGHSGVLVQGTKIGDPSVLASPDGVTVQIITHDGDVPTGMYQIGQNLLVFDRQSTSYINGYGEATLIVAAGATGFSRSVGCVAFRTIVGVGENAVCWLSERGVEYYAGGQIILLTRGGAQRFFQTVDRVSIKATPGVPCGAYDEIRQEYQLAISTNGLRNDRILVVNLLQRGQGWIGAVSIDQQQVAGAGALLFDDGDLDGYLDGGGASAFTDDAEGYSAIAGPGEGILPTAEDVDGYLTTSLADAVAATLFPGSGVDTSSVMYSLGHDGFVRRHEGVDLDDVTSAGAGGIDVELEVVSRPFLLGKAAQRKRVRAIHVASINDAVATIIAQIRADGAVLTEHTLTIPGTAFNQPQRKRVLTNAIGDAPQVVLRTTDSVRLTLVGVTAGFIREPV